MPFKEWSVRIEADTQTEVDDAEDAWHRENQQPEVEDDPIGAAMTRDEWFEQHFVDRVVVDIQKDTMRNSPLKHPDLSHIKPLVKRGNRRQFG